MKKEYKRHWLTSFGVLCFFALYGIGVFLLSFTMENQTEKYFWRYIASLILTLMGFIIFLSWRSYSIFIEDEFITMRDYEVKLGRWRLNKPTIVRIRWEDIIAVCLVRYFFTKLSFIIPKADREEINSEVKLDRKKKIAKLYIEYVKLFRKGIYICPKTNNKNNLIKEIIDRAPQAVVDEKIKRLIER